MVGDVQHIPAIRRIFFEIEAQGRIRIYPAFRSEFANAGYFLEKCRFTLHIMNIRKSRVT
jgi:hypothetical protein